MKSIPFTPLRDLARSLAGDDRGFVISAELALILTIGVLALVVGLHGLAKAINTELLDLAGAFGSLNQSYMVRGFAVVCPWWGVNAATSGSGFIDRWDECDCAAIVTMGPGYGRNFAAGGGVGGHGGFAVPATPSGVTPAVPCPPAVAAPATCPAGVDCPAVIPCPAGADCPPAVDGVPATPASPAAPAVPANPTESAAPSTPAAPAGA